METTLDVLGWMATRDDMGGQDKDDISMVRYLLESLMTGGTK